MWLLFVVWFYELFKALRAVRQALKKRRGRSRRSEDKDHKKYKEDISPKMLQNGPKMVPTWSQNRPKMTPSWCQDGPKRAQKDPKKQQKLENEKFEAPRGVYPQKGSPLGAQVGPQVDPFWTKIGDFLPTCLRRRFFIDFRTFIF